MAAVPASKPDQPTSAGAIAVGGHPSSHESPDAQGGGDKSRWQRQLADAIRSPEELLAALAFCPEEIQRLLGITPEQHPQFPTLVPRSFLNRMRPGDPADPLLRQVLATADELQSVPGFVTDPVDDAAARTAPGLLQKYHGRTLMVTTSACAVHCRYCFRREYPYQEEPRRLPDWQPAIEHISSDHSITEVILSGGDPLMLTDQRLGELLRMIDAIPHIDRIRIHTRLPIVLPARVTDAFLQALQNLRSQPIVVVHANHGNEIEGDCRDALRTIVRNGVTTLNQAVLLRDINDNLEALERLCLRLINIGVMPYYLHQLDRVQGAAHFEANRNHGTQLIKQLAEKLPGYAVPKFVQEIPGRTGKTPIAEDG